MATKVAAVEKKMDMSLDDIIRLNRRPESKVGRRDPQRGASVGRLGARAPLAVPKATQQSTAQKLKGGSQVRPSASTIRSGGVSKPVAGGRVAGLKHMMAQKVLTRARGQGQGKQVPVQKHAPLVVGRPRKKQQAPILPRPQARLQVQKVQYSLAPQPQQPRRKAVQQQQQAPKQLSMTQRMHQQKQGNQKNQGQRAPITLPRAQRAPSQQRQAAPPPKRLGVRGAGVRKPQMQQQMLVQQQHAPVYQQQYQPQPQFQPQYLPQQQFQPQYQQQYQPQQQFQQQYQAQPQYQPQMQQKEQRGRGGLSVAPTLRAPLTLRAQNPLHLQQLQMQEVERAMRRQRDEVARQLNEQFSGFTEAGRANGGGGGREGGGGRGGGGGRDRRKEGRAPTTLALPSHGGMGGSGSGGSMRGKQGRGGGRSRRS